MIRNTEYEILTPHGYCAFDGIVKNIKPTLLVKFSDGSNIVCTYNHRFQLNSKWIIAAKLKPNYRLNSKVVVSISDNGNEFVFDPINVNNPDNSYISSGVVSHNCEFSGSSSTLVDGRKLTTIAFQDPIFEKDKLKIYKKPVPGNSYVCSVDTSRGQHLDYSAFVIFDTTKVPYEVVATFKDNTISSMTYPYMIINTCKQFNDAYCLIEVNDIGGEVANIIFYEFEYPNVYFTSKSHGENTLAEGMGYPGVRTTKKVKAVGCSVLKDLVELDQLIINSFDIIQELSVFSAKGASYAAEDTKINDDLTACLFLFAWLSKQPLFTDITNTNIRSLLAKKNEEYILEQMTPFGFIDDGMDSLDDMLSSRPRDISGMALSIDDWIRS